MKKLDEQQRNAERIPLTEPLACTIDSADAQITEMSLIGAKIEHMNRLAMNSSATVQFKWKNQQIKLKAKVARTEMRTIRGKTGYSSGITFADSLDQCPPELRWVLGTFVEPIEPQAKVAPPPEPKAAPVKPAAPSTAAQSAAAAKVAAAFAPAPKPTPAAPAPAPKPTPAAPAPAVVKPAAMAQTAATAPKPSTPAPVASPAKAASAIPQPKPSAPPIPTTPAPFLQADDDVEEIDAAAEVPPYVRCEYGDDGAWVKTRTDEAKQPLSGFTMLAPESDDDVDDFCRTYEMADPETQRMIRLSFELAIAQFRRK